MRSGRSATREPKACYRVKKWMAYNEGLIGNSKRRTLRKEHLAFDANTSQMRMTRQEVADGDVLAELLGQIPADELRESVSGDGAYCSKPCHAPLRHAERHPVFHHATMRFTGR
ncbi:hypothetical protein WS93_19470 [Burkholderia cepacia]|nr:hypothetical protein WS93_19470 [Burkholderia cepacia]